MTPRAPTRPTRTGTGGGLAWTAWLPPDGAPPPGCVLVLHGAGSCQENHHDFAAACLGAGLAALCFDQRGHGASDGALGEGALDDVAAMAARLCDLAGGAPLVLRGSSMGGYLALVTAGRVRARAVVAICPAGAEHLRAGLARGDPGFTADRAGLESLLRRHDAGAAVAALRAPLLICHAQGDESIPVEHSRALHRRSPHPGSELIEVPGGHHRSLQHDPRIRDATLSFILRALTARRR